MEGLIPFLLHAVKKQRPQNAYRCLSENSTTGRSYHLLLAGDSVEGGSSHRRTRSDFQPSSTVDFSSGSEHLPRVKSLAARGPTASPSDADNGLRHRGFTSASHYQVSGRSNNHGR
ncbi:hypothetical protein Salat_1619900 [Sesamum alatum]|uniref:Uncharacterized protein n=1 Tax=Sesamum alatum TaxID=300844 RepID=A0AAE2CJB3_9LAMI|nr:hypothetical protein Salat_1619900 [Sesamum alatum]